MIAWARPSVTAAPPMSFFISSMLLRGLEVEAAGVEAHALADQRELGRVRLAPGQLDQARRARAGAADRVDRRVVLGQQVVADSMVREARRRSAPRPRLAASASSAGPRSEAGVLIRSRASQTASAVASASRTLGARLERQAQRLRLALAVALEAVARERPAERRVARPGRRARALEAPVARRQARAQAREIPGLDRLARDQQRALGRAARARQQRHARGLGLEAGALEPGARGAPAARRASRA